MVCVIFFLLGVWTLGVGGTTTLEPSFVEPIPNITIAAGRDIKLHCVIDNLGSYKVAWIAFDKSAILTVQEHVITRNPRVRITHDGQRTWTLHISDVNSTDAGTYMCQVNTIIAKSQFGVLSVVVPPNIVDSDTSTDVKLKEGENVTLTCTASGTPTPSITWRREDNLKINLNKTHQVSEHNGPHLYLDKISRMDMGAYLCIASNGVPPIVSKRIQVSVEFPPMMSIPHQLVGAPVGYSVTMECTIEAHPPALTYWTLGQSGMLHVGQKYNITNIAGKVSYRTFMKLTVRSLQKEDFGPYKCVAKNSRGETEGHIKLYETQPPTTAPTSPPSYFDKLYQEFNSKTTRIVATTDEEDDKPSSNNYVNGDTGEGDPAGGGGGGVGGGGGGGGGGTREGERNRNQLRMDKESREEKRIQENRSQNPRGEHHYEDGRDNNREEEHHPIRFFSHGWTVHQYNPLLLLRSFALGAMLHHLPL